ncbi:methanogen output domain 1-containing protein [Thiovibrio sp. JS02]
MSSSPSLQHLDIPLERDLFLRTLIRELAGTLEDVVGHEEAAGYIGLVGQNIGRWLNDIYRKTLAVQQLSPAQVAMVLVDLKQRIQGDFFLVSQDAEKIVLGSNSCPFADKVIDRPSMCMMTSSVFGVISAENLGYARVALEETIAGRDPRCKVTVYLKPSQEAGMTQGREYFRT